VETSKTIFTVTQGVTRYTTFGLLRFLKLKPRFLNRNSTVLQLLPSYLWKLEPPYWYSLFIMIMAI